MYTYACSGTSVARGESNGPQQLLPAVVGGFSIPSVRPWATGSMVARVLAAVRHRTLHLASHSGCVRELHKAPRSLARMRRLDYSVASLRTPHLRRKLKTPTYITPTHHTA